MTQLDRSGSLLAAVGLIEAEKQDRGERDRRVVALLPTDPTGLITLTASLSWCAAYLAGQLADQMGVDYQTITEAVRLEIIERFEGEK